MFLVIEAITLELFSKSLAVNWYEPDFKTFKEILLFDVFIICAALESEISYWTL